MFVSTDNENNRATEAFFLCLESLSVPADMEVVELVQLPSCGCRMVFQ